MLSQIARSMVNFGASHAPFPAMGQKQNNTLSRFQIGLSITVTGMFLSACIWILSMCIASLESGLTESVSLFVWFPT
jgi:hypothetical protein